MMKRANPMDFSPLKFPCEASYTGNHLSKLWKKNIWKTNYRETKREKVYISGLNIMDVAKSTIRKVGLPISKSNNGTIRECIGQTLIVE